MKKRTIKIVISLILFVISLSIAFSSIWLNNSIYIISYLIVGLEIVKKAIRNIIRGKVFDENFLMTIATLGAFSIGEFPEAVAVMLFYQIGELFQDYAVDKSRKSISSLMEMKPDFANRKREEKIDDEKIRKVITDFFEMKEIDKMLLYKLINRIEIDTEKNIYIYFNFNHLNIISDNLKVKDGMIEYEKIMKTG